MLKKQKKMNHQRYLTNKLSYNQLRHGWTFNNPTMSFFIEKSKKWLGYLDKISIFKSVGNFSKNKIKIIKS